MDHEQVINLAGSALLVVCAVIGTTSVIVHTGVKWRRSPWGRHLMAYMSAIALVCDLGVVRLVIGDSFAFQLLRLAVFATIPVVMGQRLYLQLKARAVDRAAAAAAADRQEGTPDA